MQTYLILPALALSLAAVTPALAVDDVFGGNRLNVPRERWLSPEQIAQKLGEKGYTVREIEADDGAYEVEMVDKNGMRVEAHVHPETADMLVGYDDD
jgi:hypothetical protein